MDFSLEEQHEDLRALTAGLLAREATVERLVAHEESGAPYDATTWKAMAQAGLLGLVLPEDEGGQGFGPLELAVVLEEVGRRAAPVPALASLALGALPVARYGTPAQRAALLPAVSVGDALLTAAVREPVPIAADQPATPATTATPTDGGYRLDGVKVGVPYAAHAGRILVPASTPGGVGVFLVDPASAGVELAPSHTSHGHPESRLGLTGVRVPADALLGDAADGEAARYLADVAAASICAVGVGAVAEALRLTTEHLRTREQFGRPLGTFQAAAGEIADVYIASQALQAATRSACWRLATGRDARGHLGVAGYWLAHHGVRALNTCQHLHGGIGVDVTYPLHRYFSLTRYLGHSLGGTGRQLDRLGALVGDGTGEVA